MVYITGTGLYHPEHSLTNEQLVEVLNAHAARFNTANAAAIDAGEINALATSDADFIYKASGIKSRYVMDPTSIMDLDVMEPRLPLPGKEDLTYMARFAVAAGQQAMDAAGLTASDVDLVICGASNFERPYPAIAVEIQNALGIGQGYAFDMNVACSSATFALHTAKALIEGTGLRNVLIVNPELTTPQMDYANRDSHFIFGDVCTAMIMSAEPRAGSAWKVTSTATQTSYSTNVWSESSYMNHVYVPARKGAYFSQNGRQVMKDVCPLVAKMIKGHLEEQGSAPDQMDRYWLHQANQHMNDFVAKALMGKDFAREAAPLVLDEFGNTGSAGSVIAFHRHNDDLPVGSQGLLCSFGAGYSAGLAVMERAA